MMSVRKAVRDDIDELVRLRIAYLKEDNGQLDDRDAETIAKELPDYFRRHLGRDLFCYVWQEGGEIVASAFLLLVEKPMSPAFINGRTGTVLNVYTCPEHRRRGYAAQVMRRLLADAGEMELSVVELKSTDAGYPLYRSVGFADDASGYHPMKWRNQ